MATRPTFVLATALLLSACHLPAPSSTSPRLSDTERAVHLLSRTTYGVRPSDVEELARMGRGRWLDRQLHPERIADPFVDTLDQQAVPRPTPHIVLSPLFARSDSMARPVPEPSMHTPVVRLRVLGNGIDDLLYGKLQRAIRSRRQLEEVMTDFWFNHFNVEYRKVGTNLGHFETQTIRRHVFGRFEDMLLAVAEHPAMLVYLDNYLSTAPGPRSPLGGGINENYARELLELHTLGVDGGYTQQDVIEVARAFTGWSVPTRTNALSGVRTAAGGSLQMTFHPEWHDGGEKVVLGHRLAAGRGIEDGREVIALLSRHPATARHIATKLVTHFVTDEPPLELIDEVARVFIATDGDLREVTRALFTSELFYRPEHYRAKVKRPFEFFASALRVTGTETQRGQPIRTVLRGMFHEPYMQPAPTGYSTTADDWMSAGALFARVKLALELTAGVYLVSPADPWALLGVQEGEAQAFVEPTVAGVRYDTGALTRALLERTLYGVPAPDVERTIAADLSRQDTADLSALVMRAVGLLLGSPEFQKY